jgi:glycosyltransferase involved in cell wall biosynthesis
VKCKLAIITEIIAPYRIPVFNELCRRTDLDLHVIFLAETDPTQRQWKVYKDEIDFSYEVLPSWRRRIGRYHCLLNWGMAPALTRFAPDVIICGGYNYLASWIALRWARNHRVPMLLWVESTPRDRRSGRGLMEFLKTQFMQRCERFVVPGKSSFQYVRGYGMKEEAIYTAPNAVDVEFFAGGADHARRAAARYRSKLNLPSHFFLFAGRLIAGKGVFDLLRAYESQPPELRSEWGLVFVGQGEAMEELQRRATRLQTGRVHFAGFAQREQLAMYYGLADVFVMPTHSDPWGLVVNEAMACRLPVIVSEAAGCAEDLVQDGRNGYTFAPGDVPKLAALMNQMASNETQRVEMGERGRQLILSYSPQASANGIASATLAQGFSK